VELFRDPDNRINGWIITRQQAPQRKVTMGEKERAHIFLLRKIYGHDDEAGSELVFQKHLEDVQNTFDDDDYVDLNDECLTTIPDWGPMSGLAGFQIDNAADLRLISGILCHYAECRLCAIERVEDT